MIRVLTFAKILLIGVFVCAQNNILQTFNHIRFFLAFSIFRAFRYIYIVDTALLNCKFPYHKFIVICFIFILFYYYEVGFLFAFVEFMSLLLLLFCVQITEKRRRRR